MSTDVNVKVAVRCRPMSSRETQMGARGVVQVLDGTTVVMYPTADAQASASTSPASETSEASEKKQYTFDFAYYTESTQAQVYGDIAKPLVDQALQGYNGTIFAYGQTGSGKTHTMMGSGDDHGIVPLMNGDLFARINASDAENTNSDDEGAVKYLVTVSFLEIYNEVIKDLLNPSDKVLKIREHPDMGIYVEQLAELVVRDPADVTRLLEQGNKVRQVAATQMNERSSRSHSCFTIKISSKRSQVMAGVRKETCMNAKINLVDLAGSERASKTGATGDRLKEGAAINKSLSALGNVINMLASSDKTRKGKAHIPYRDSKLTRLLQESLGGNSLTVMIAAISPADYNFEESLGTLVYANRAKSIKNATKKNEDINEKIIRELREEIEKLRQMVARPTSASSGNPEMMGQMEETIANLERAKQQSWEEKQRLTELYEQERQNSLANEKKILGFMQTVKQEKMDIMKKIKVLRQQKVQLSKEMRVRKQSYVENKSKLQQGVQAFTQMKTETPREKQHLMEQIESRKSLLITDRDELSRLKEELKFCEEKLVEEEAEVAAKSALLEEDDKLRRAIQDDEREKMKRERAAYLQSALDEERQRFQLEADNDKQRLKVALEATADKEKKLAEEVEKQRNRALQLQQQMHQMQLEHNEWKDTTKVKMLQMMEALKRDFLQEQREMHERQDYTLYLLRNARDDIVQLGERNQDLEKRLHELIIWD
ncbi:kinesin-like protein [Phytophthora infestans T30-4]|uniref:Kinesin-like protein n=1 Tax=Phytophthora infestans (strain T30-4) TaxID=403677 RepID=D0MSW9_PHYIT|nr:kinesin-like protein [Phytophthora infestans T30-4]EEY57553.1 kinesin-like protein [Phytophthora infestans T30-4]|eukprot:XP_002908739.1 kinesin-like protein [Phytophthora infestans T30-4]